MRKRRSASPLPLCLLILLSWDVFQSRGTRLEENWPRLMLLADAAEDSLALRSAPVGSDNKAVRLPWLDGSPVEAVNIQGGASADLKSLIDSQVQPGVKWLTLFPMPSLIERTIDYILFLNSLTSFHVLGGGKSYVVAVADAPSFALCTRLRLPCFNAEKVVPRFLLDSYTGQQWAKLLMAQAVLRALSADLHLVYAEPDMVFLKQLHPSIERFAERQTFDIAGEAHDVNVSGAGILPGINTGFFLARNTPRFSAFLDNVLANMKLLSLLGPRHDVLFEPIVKLTAQQPEGKGAVIDSSKAALARFKPGWILHDWCQSCQHNEGRCFEFDEANHCAAARRLYVHLGCTQCKIPLLQSMGLWFINDTDSLGIDWAAIKTAGLPCSAPADVAALEVAPFPVNGSYKMSESELAKRASDVENELKHIQLPWQRPAGEPNPYADYVKDLPALIESQRQPGVKWLTLIVVNQLWPHGQLFPLLMNSLTSLFLFGGIKMFVVAGTTAHAVDECMRFRIPCWNATDIMTGNMSGVSYNTGVWGKVLVARNVLRLLPEGLALHVTDADVVYLKKVQDSMDRYLQVQSFDITGESLPNCPAPEGINTGVLMMHNTAKTWKMYDDWSDMATIMENDQDVYQKQILKLITPQPLGHPPDPPLAGLSRLKAPWLGNRKCGQCENMEKYTGCYAGDSPDHCAFPKRLFVHAVCAHGKIGYLRGLGLWFVDWDNPLLTNWTAVAASRLPCRPPSDVAWLESDPF